MVEEMIEFDGKTWLHDLLMTTIESFNSLLWKEFLGYRYAMRLRKQIVWFFELILTFSFLFLFRFTYRTYPKEVCRKWWIDLVCKADISLVRYAKGVKCLWDVYLHLSHRCYHIIVFIAVLICYLVNTYDTDNLWGYWWGWGKNLHSYTFLLSLIWMDLQDPTTVSNIKKHII